MPADSGMSGRAWLCPYCHHWEWAIATTQKTEHPPCPATGIHSIEVAPGEYEPDWDKPCGTTMVKAWAETRESVVERAW